MKAQLLQRWQQLAPREQRAIHILSVVLALYAIWMITIAPAQRSLQASAQAQIQLERQLLVMQQMAQVAQKLKDQTAMPTDQSWRALQTVSSATAGIDVRQQARRVMVELRSVSANDLAHWLSQVREQSQSSVLEAHLTPSEKGWSGQMVLLLPGKEGQ